MAASSRTAPGPAIVVNLRREPYDIYIGRPGRGQTGPWGNPFRLCAESQRPAVPERYRQWLERQGAAGRGNKNALAALHGKRTAIPSALPAGKINDRNAASAIANACRNGKPAGTPVPLPALNR